MTTQIETIMIGGGQAGLATSYHLSRRQCEHIVFEKGDQPGNAWAKDRWDSFCLNTPNWAFRLPGAEYHDSAPDAYMERPEIVARFEAYVREFELPIRYGVTVTAVEQDGAGCRYLVRTEDGDWAANNVVIATGLFQYPKRPSGTAEISPRITQLAASEYRNPDTLPPGAVLVVGSAQSGCQIAEELYKSGRHVYLCTGSGGRAPRRYRGKDTFEWLDRSGFFNRPAESLPTPQTKYMALPQLSGNDGGHNLNLNQFSLDGVTLLGHWQGGDESTLHFAPDLRENLAKADAFEAQLLKTIDTFIDQAGLDAPEEEVPYLRNAYDDEIITAAGILESGITSIIWATGFGFDFSMVKLPVLAADGYPVQHKGITSYPGLYFAGLPWLEGIRSGLLVGVGEQTADVAQAISAK
ncbi:MAG: NAD(P)-binding domain-containing protein [Candidatus Promineifilaceae bacterium]